MLKTEQVLLTMKASGLTKKQLAILEETINKVFLPNLVDIDDQTVLDRFIDHCRFKEYSELTVNGYASLICKLSEYSTNNLVELTADEIQDFITYSKNENKISAATVNNYIACFRTFYKWLYRKEYIGANPMDKIDVVKEPIVEQKAFSVIELEQLRNACVSLRDRALLEFMLSTMCRRSEICNLKMKDINLDNMSVNVIQGKGKKDRFTFFNDTTKIYLQKYLNSRTNLEPEDYLFANEKGGGKIEPNTLYVWLKRLSKKAHVQNAHPHKFRRTGASELSRKGANPKAIQIILGHSNMSTTSDYIDLNSESAHNEYRRVS